MDKVREFESTVREKWDIPKFKDIQALMERSKKQCVDLFKMTELILVAVYTYTALSKMPSFFDEKRHISHRYANTLAFLWLIELLRISRQTVFLSGSGCYRSAYNNIRYFLESAVQSLYMDFKHKNSDVFTKIEILKEVENRVEYRGVRLIGELEIKHKKEVTEEYRKLSKEIHASHWQIFVTMSDFQRGTFDIEVDCKKVSNIYGSMRRIYDIFFFLFLKYFSEVRKPLTENREFVKVVKDHDLKLLSKILNI